MNEKELISKLRGLKQIKPRKDWVVLVKNQILGSNVVENEVNNKPVYGEILLNIFKAFFQKKFAYALAVFLVIVIGMFGFMKSGFINDADIPKIVEQSPAALVAIKNNVETFKIKSKNLADVAKYSMKDASLALALKEVKDIAIELTDAIKKDPQLAKAIALEINNNKTYLNIEGGDDLKETSDILYKTIAEQRIKDLKNTTLTESQQKGLKIAERSCNDKKFTNCMEDVLLLSMAVEEMEHSGKIEEK